MFLKFDSQDDRRKYGGSCFVELQFCKLPRESSLKEILGGIEYWRDDSLYVHGDSPIYQEYKDIFGFGILDNGVEDGEENVEEGLFNYYGVTYYKPELIDEIIERARDARPDGYATLIAWLEEAKQYNGFYISGL